MYEQTNKSVHHRGDADQAKHVSKPYRHGALKDYTSITRINLKLSSFIAGNSVYYVDTLLWVTPWFYNQSSVLWHA